MMKKQTFFHVLLVAAAVGVPGFLAFDRTGLTQDFGLFNAHSLSRIALYMVLGFIFVWVLTLSKIQQIKYGVTNSPSLTPEGFRLLFLLYGIFLLSLVKAGGTTDILLGLYRICEWILVIGLCSVALGMSGNTLSERHRASDTFFRLLKYITTIPVVIVFIGTVIVPHLAIGHSGGHIRLGGYLFGPNSLGLLAGIGAVVFWFRSTGLKSRIWAGVLLVTMMSTYSRGATIGFLVSMAVAYLAHRKVPKKLLAWTAVPAVFLIVLAFGELFYDDALGVLMRTGSMEDVLTLNSRTDVWSAAYQAILNSPLIGHGFVFGPKDLGSVVGASWWNAPHAHNDVLNAGVAGGLVAAVLTLMIYIRVGHDVLTMERPAAEKAAVVAVYVQITVYAMLTPVFSGPVHFQGIIFLLLMRYMALMVPMPTHSEEMYRPMGNARSYRS